MNDQDSRLKRIRKDLADIKSTENTKEKKQIEKDEDSESMAVGLRAGAELVTSIAAGGLIGYWLDNWLETKPIFLIAMLLLGVITGFVNVWRTTRNIGYQVGYKDIKKNDKENI
tara:strand:- start:1820 stop:2161 length:342 start_codon:yes stop_codon:yes gene_type:complete